MGQACSSSNNNVAPAADAAQSGAHAAASPKQKATLSPRESNRSAVKTQRKNPAIDIIERHLGASLSGDTGNGCHRASVSLLLSDSEADDILKDALRDSATGAAAGGGGGGGRGDGGGDSARAQLQRANSPSNVPVSGAVAAARRRANLIKQANQQTTLGLNSGWTNGDFSPLREKNWNRRRQVVAQYPMKASAYEIVGEIGCKCVFDVYVCSQRVRVCGGCVVRLAANDI
jgi:hypothetical protein